MPGSEPEHPESQSIFDVTHIENLVSFAKRASANAYCPYSQFRVGAAVLTISGAIYSGCNVENASYSATICAERNAIFSMVTAGEKAIAAIVIYTPTQVPSAPCGPCRQVINEFGSEARILCVCDGPETIDLQASDLLPRAFGKSNLGK